MERVLFFILLCHGLTLIITQSAIMNPVRMLFYGWVPSIHKLLTCVMCSGFWVGLLVAVGSGFSPTQLFLHSGTLNGFFTAVFDGAFTSGILWLIHLIQLNFEKNVQDYI